MGGTRPSAVAGAALLALAIVPSVFAASSAELAPISIGFSTASVAPGSTLAIGWKIANTGGKGGKAKVAVSLIGSGQTTKLTSRSVTVRAHNKARYRVTATIPISAADGSYAVRICVARKCVTAKAKLTLMEAIREIVGEPRFVEIQHTWLTDHRYGNATTEDYIALVKSMSDKDPARWDEFFEEWLYTSYPGTPSATNRPQMNPTNFDTFVLPA